VGLLLVCHVGLFVTSVRSLIRSLLSLENRFIQSVDEFAANDADWQKHGTVAQTYLSVATTTLAPLPPLSIRFSTVLHLSLFV